MRCPYQNSQFPPCTIINHPYKEDVEYCRVCDEWRYISQVGGWGNGMGFPNMVWSIVMIAIAMMLFVALVNEVDKLKQQPKLFNYEVGCNARCSTLDGFGDIAGAIDI